MTLHLPRAVAAGPRAAAMLAIALSFAACGGGPAASDDGVVSLASPTAAPSGSAGPSASVDPEVAMEAFTKCMRDHGVDVQVAVVGDGKDGGGTVGGGPVLNQHTGNDDPQSGPRQLDPKAMEAAEAACRPLLPSGTLGDPSATMDPALADQMLAFSRCMRDHGIDFPDPKFDGGGMSIALGGPDGTGPDPNSDAFKAAQAACGSELPGGGPGMIGGGPATEAQP